MLARRRAASVPVVSSYPRNPPFAADETSMLRAWIDYYRDTIRAQTDGLDADQLAARIPGHPAVMTLGGMLKHLAFVEQWWFTVALHDRPPSGIWADVDWASDNAQGQVTTRTASTACQTMASIFHWLATRARCPRISSGPGIE